MVFCFWSESTRLFTLTTWRYVIGFKLFGVKYSFIINVIYILINNVTKFVTLFFTMLN